MPLLTARIWLYSPDVFDGYFVEIIDSFDIQIDTTWFVDLEACERWAERRGATKVDYV